MIWETLTSKPTNASRTMSQLAHLESLEANWDGYGAAKPKEASLAAGRLFLSHLDPESFLLKATLHADGDVLLFGHTDTKYIELEFLPDNVIGYHIVSGDEHWGGEFMFDGIDLPNGFREVGLFLRKGDRA